METRIDGRDGWVEVTRAGVHVLAKGDDALRERLESALGGAAADDDLPDVVTDELSTGGVRRTPDFAVVDEIARRVLVRGTARVEYADESGTPGEVVAPARGPWADEDLAEGTLSVTLSTGEPEPEPAAPEVAENGWAMPSVFGAAGAGSAAVAGAPAAAPEPASLDEPVPEGTPETTDGADALPEYDVLFAGADQAQGAPEDLPEASEAPVDSGPVAAAGGYQPPENPVNATLAPPSEDEESLEAYPDQQAEPEAAPVFTGSTGHDAPAGTDAGVDAGTGIDAGVDEDAHDDGGPGLGTAAAVGGAAGGAAALGGATMAYDGDEPDAESVGDASGDTVDPRPESEVEPAHEGLAQGGLAQEAPADEEPAGSSPAEEAPVAEDRAERPQFVDGHLVSSFVAAGAEQSSVDAPRSEEMSPADVGPASATVPTSVEDTGELPAGPVVLAVRCMSGHHNAPHATRCRVCGQELPTQQPEPTVRPALGVLRLSTGDVVTLDRGVLVGRAPRSPHEVDSAEAPHLLRVASPDNEISRNHVEVVLDGWHVLVRDLGSTNGTTVALPGSSPVRVRPDDQQSIEPGTTITLADQVSMVFEVTG